MPGERERERGRTNRAMVWSHFTTFGQETECEWVYSFNHGARTGPHWSRLDRVFTLAVSNVC